MIAKILSSSSSFAGVIYNTDKVTSGNGKLVRVVNFGALQMLSDLRPADYINYFKAVSSVNTRVSRPQFHAVISGKGKGTAIEELTDVAERWLSKMGYAENPYLIISHSDTLNNHVHMVSTRVDRSGKKISSAFEKLRSLANLRACMVQRTAEEPSGLIKSAMGYRFSTRAQLRLLLEMKGFKCVQSADQIIISLGERYSHAFDLKEIDHKIEHTIIDKKRIAQLGQIFLKYSRKYDTALLTTGTSALDHKLNKPVRRSDFGDFVFSKFGIQLIYHSNGKQPPYGYTIIDQSENNVFKGSEIMPLKDFVGHVANADKIQTEENLSQFNTPLLNKNIAHHIENENTAAFEISAGTFQLAQDIDDEALLGRNRQRKGKARTNTR